MSIGGALAEARSEAGLSVTEVSERTRIRATIIRDIERDDYAACGGDFYARGHIRAIAKVVGADPVPLIAEYDAALRPDEDSGPAAGLTSASDSTLSTGAGPLADPMPAGGMQAGLARAGPGPAGQPGGESDTEQIPQAAEPRRDELAAIRARLADSGRVAGARLAELTRAIAAHLTDSAHAAGGWIAAQSGRIERGGRDGASWRDRAARAAEPRPRLIAALALALLAAIGLLIYLLVAGPSGQSSGARAQSGVAGLRRDTASGHQAAPGSAGAGLAGTGAAGSGAAGSGPAGSGPAGSGPATPGVAEPRPVLLTPAGIAAFGPGGTATADDPQSASLAIDGSDRTAWHTAWYTTPDFGRLQSGTGLLLDMGQPVAISSVSIIFGPARGGAFELRAGNAPALASLLPVARAADRGGAVTVHVVRPARARYLLIWVTRLPPDASGTYQAVICNLAVRGVR